MGSITDGAGNITLQPGFTVSASDSLVFDYLGRALRGMTYTVTSSTTGSTLTVSVATSGRSRFHRATDLSATSAGI